MIVEGKEIEMYDFMIKAVAKRVGLKKISYEAGFGGGNSISDQLMAKIESRYIVVCICDNDKITPTGGVGDTLQRLRRMASGLHKFIGNTYENAGSRSRKFFAV
ncbi:hypothetical protein VZ95_19855 [Elstera litoralis]|uniref:Uncharacterized protein n=1 Tax=Elstera litoralis TaxID=552518 RepID=A0A0F3ILP1_9PROT|nr:hypothetical protein VZ95_19855 [Elstera litoralis]